MGAVPNGVRLEGARTAATVLGGPKAVSTLCTPSARPRGLVSGLPVAAAGVRKLAPRLLGKVGRAARAGGTGAAGRGAGVAAAGAEGAGAVGGVGAGGWAGAGVGGAVAGGAATGGAGGGVGSAVCGSSSGEKGLRVLSPPPVTGAGISTSSCFSGGSVTSRGNSSTPTSRATAGVSGSGRSGSAPPLTSAGCSSAPGSVAGSVGAGSATWSASAACSAGFSAVLGAAAKAAFWGEGAERSC